MAQAEQAAYDAGMTKTTESLTVQLRDIARAFCLEVWSQALSAAGVSIESELRAPNKVYYPLALHLAPASQQPLVDPTFSSPVSSNQPASVPSSTLAKGKEQEKERPPPTEKLDVETEEEVTEVSQLKRKKKERE